MLKLVVTALFASLALAAPAHADRIEPDGLGGYKVYDSKGRVKERWVPRAGSEDNFTRYGRDGDRKGTVEGLRARDTKGRRDDVLKD
jgi:hypothetical protein